MRPAPSSRRPFAAYMLVAQRPFALSSSKGVVRQAQHERQSETVTKRWPADDGNGTLSAVDALAPHTALTNAEVTAVACRVLGAASTTVTAWEVAPLSYARVMVTSGGVFRVTGTAAVGRDTRPWSAILKIARSPIGVVTANGRIPPGWAETPDHYLYWKREPLLYASGLLDLPHGGLRAPACYAVSEPAPGAAWLWLEEVQDLVPGPWNLDRYRLAARHLGHLNGAYVSASTDPAIPISAGTATASTALPSRQIPDVPWLAGGSWLRRALTQRRSRSIAALVADDSLWQGALVRAVFPDTGAVRSRLSALEAARERLLDALDALPQTLCHGDAHRPNLFATSDATRRDPAAPTAASDATCAIDWSFTSIGPVGEDPATLVAGSLVALDIAAGDAPDLERACLSGYAAGLADAGARVSAAQQAYGYACAAAVHWGLFSQHLADVLDPHCYPAAESRWDRPMLDLARQWAGVVHYVLDLGDRVLTQPPLEYE